MCVCVFRISFVFQRECVGNMIEGGGEQKKTLSMKQYNALSSGSCVKLASIEHSMNIFIIFVLVALGSNNDWI